MKVFLVIARDCPDDIIVAAFSKERRALNVAKVIEVNTDMKARVQVYELNPTDRNLTYCWARPKYLRGK